MISPTCSGVSSRSAILYPAAPHLGPAWPSSPIRILWYQLSLRTPFCIVLPYAFASMIVWQSAHTRSRGRLPFASASTLAAAGIPNATNSPTKTAAHFKVRQTAISSQRRLRCSSQSVSACASIACAPAGARSTYRPDRQHPRMRLGRFSPLQRTPRMFIAAPGMRPSARRIAT